MQLPEMIAIAQNRITKLQESRAFNVQEGNAQRVAELDTEILETQDTLNKLNTING